LFAVMSAAVAVLRELDGQPPAAPAALPPECRLVVYYFHTDKRCASCNTIESAAKRAVAEGFAADQEAGRVIYRDINWQLPGNAGYQSAYKLAFSTVVLSSVRDGQELRYNRLDEAWQMLTDPDGLARHIAAEMKAMLEDE
jgi:hypothetical protein